jgi:poly-gamma-glutamate system protein
MNRAVDMWSRLGLGDRRWVTSRVSRRWLLVAALLSIGAWQATERLVGASPHAQSDVLIRAARTALAAQREIARIKEQMGLLQPAAVDPNRTGLIGLDWSEITTTIGDLPAKRTVTNPDLAATIARRLQSFDLPRGAAVGLVLSGSFVGANLAAISAVEALGLRPVVVSSLGASMYGANDPDFTWLDMETAVARAGIWQARSTAVVLGGESAVANSLGRTGHDMLVAAARRNGHEPIEAPEFGELKGRLHAALTRAAPDGLVALINSGGSVLGMGTCLDAHRLPSGLLKGKLPCEAGVTGLVHDFAARGIPVIHILNVKRLALDWNLPFDPVPLPPIGENARVYGRMPIP